jgi:hypothetical protein
VLGSLRKKVLLSVGERGPLAVNESEVSRRRVDGREALPVLLLYGVVWLFDTEVFLTPVVFELGSFGWLALRGELTELENSWNNVSSITVLKAVVQPVFHSHSGAQDHRDLDRPGYSNKLLVQLSVPFHHSLLVLTHLLRPGPKVLGIGLVNFYSASPPPFDSDRYLTAAPCYIECRHWYHFAFDLRLDSYVVEYMDQMIRV